jgi:hypothetical protein
LSIAKGKRKTWETISDEEESVTTVPESDIQSDK